MSLSSRVASKLPLILVLMLLCGFCVLPVSAAKAYHLYNMSLDLPTTGYLYITANGMGPTDRINTDLPDIIIVSEQNISLWNMWTEDDTVYARHYLNVLKNISAVPVFILPDHTIPKTYLKPGNYSVILTVGSGGNLEIMNVTVVKSKVTYVPFIGYHPKKTALYSWELPTVIPTTVATCPPVK